MVVRNFKLETNEGVDVRSNSLDKLSESDLKNESNKKAMKHLFNAFNTKTEKLDGEQILDEQEIDKMFEIISTYTNRTNRSNDDIFDREEAQAFLDTYEISPGKTLSKDYNVTVDIFFEFLKKFVTKDKNNVYSDYSANVAMNEGRDLVTGDPFSRDAELQERNLTFETKKSFYDKSKIDHYLNWGAICTNKPQTEETDDTNQPSNRSEYTDVDMLGNTIFYEVVNGKQVIKARIIERSGGAKIIEIFDKYKDGIASGTAYYAEQFTDNHITTHKKGEPIYSFKEDRSKPFKTREDTTIYNRASNDFEFSGARYYFRTQNIIKYDGKGNYAIYDSLCDAEGKPTGITGKLKQIYQREYDSTSGNLLYATRKIYDANGNIVTTERENAQTHNSTVYDANNNLLMNKYADLDEHGNVEMLTVVNVQKKTRRVYLYNNSNLKSAEEIMNDDKEFLDYFKNVVVSDIDNAIEYLEEYDDDANLFQSGAMLISDIFGGDTAQEKIDKLSDYKKNIKKILKMTDTKEAIREIRSLGFDIVKYRALKNVSDKYTNASLFQAMEDKINNTRTEIAKNTKNYETFTDTRKDRLIENIQAYAKHKAEKEKLFLKSKLLETDTEFSNETLTESLTSLFSGEKDEISPSLYKAYDVLSSIFGSEKAETILNGIIKNENIKSSTDLIYEIDTVLSQIQSSIKLEKEDILNGMSLKQLGSQFNQLYDSALGETQVDKAHKYTDKIDSFANALELVTDVGLLFVGGTGLMVKGVGMVANLGTKAPKLANMATKIVTKYEKLATGNLYARGTVYLADETMLNAAKGNSISFDNLSGTFARSLLMNKARVLMRIPMKSVSEKVYNKVKKVSQNLADRGSFNEATQNALAKINYLLETNPDCIETIFAEGLTQVSAQISGVSSLGKEEEAIIKAYAENIRVQKISENQYSVTIDNETYNITGSAKEVYLALFSEENQENGFSSNS